MESSLEELLAEEGFRGRKSGARSRSSLRSEALSKTDSPFSNRVKTERRRSDVSWNNLRGELSRSDSTIGRRPRDLLVGREKINGELKKENKERLEGRGSIDRQEDNWLNINSSEDSQRNEIVEIGVEENERVKDVFANEGRHSLGRRGKRNDIASSKHLLGRRSYSDKHRNSLQQRETAYDKANRGSQISKSFQDGQHQKRDDLVPTVSHPALDRVAIRAIVSILCGYIKRFLQNEEFRTALHHNCFSSLNCIMLEDYNIEGKIIVNLEQAIEIVEKAVEESVSAKELKKASLQLSVITGLNSNDLKDGFTFGVPNAMLSSCAHLYLSVIYKLQKKDRVSAKHLLQVFCDSPSQARTNLLPELWDNLFFPHLSHLKAWYNQEANSLSDAPSKKRKLKLLEKVYNEIMDSSTYQLAVYYKDWLTEGVEAPSFPSIHVPSVSVGNVLQEGSPPHSPDLGSPAGPFSPQPMVSKKLYDAVFGRSSKPGLEETEDNSESHSYDTCRRSCDGSTVDVKQTLTYSYEEVKHPYQDIGEASSKSPQDDASFLEDRISSTAEEEWSLPGLSMLREKDIHCTNNSTKADNTRQTTARDSDMLQAPVLLSANELMLKQLAKSAFEPQQTEGTDDLTLSSLQNPSEEPMHSSLENKPSKFRPSFEELLESDRYIDERSLFSSIPKDFICRLTGKLFEEPVTLETGQTFEREAIKEWFNQGNKTCPVTGKMLEYLSVPLTNFILKRVIDSWKLENCRHTLALAFLIVGNSREHGSPSRGETATFILEQCITTLSREERIMNIKHLISLGGLPFLIQRFKSENMEEKTRVAMLLSCCIEADSGCRYDIARDIKKQCLFELVCSKQVKSRRNAVLLLTELICLSRRKDVPLFLSDLQHEEIMDVMHALHVYLQSSPPDQRPLVATLLLNIDLLSFCHDRDQHMQQADPPNYGLYREEAVDVITAALDSCLLDEEVRENCCRALFILGGRFTVSGKLLTEGWILKLAGFNDDREVNFIEKDEDLEVDDTILLEDEECANEEWLRNLSTSLVGSGKKSFLEAISKCLGSGNSDLVTACLTTVAWLTGALSSITDARLQLSTFFTLISQLKQSLENGALVQHKVLASISLLNLSKISECRVLLMTIAEEIAVPLGSIVDVTWTAKQLYGIISGLFDCN
ncbi:putative E3 ubiquitin-protein ligase LIN-1 isoform X2 [Durio zibethinus]|uniref:RING-type E3 ubiquitin transferase n=1 Tax=Durio zibethinus TaxID=66656 RepID=A0A6P5XV52_DURZI|nr:putative E3 ubiquitin-protein ligase LIN-1 isoform X2 [Durio zibethinus]